MPPKKARLSAETAINNILRFVKNDEDKCVKAHCLKIPPVSKHFVGLVVMQHVRNIYFKIVLAVPITTQHNMAIF